MRDWLAELFLSGREFTMLFPLPAGLLPALLPMHLLFMH